VAEAFPAERCGDIIDTTYIGLMALLLQHVRPKLYKPDQIQKLHGDLEAQLEEMERLHAEEYAVLLPLETLIVEAACDDPGALFLPHLILPLIREQLEATAGIQPHLRSKQQFSSVQVCALSVMLQCMNVRGCSGACCVCVCRLSLCSCYIELQGCGLSPYLLLPCQSRGQNETHALAS